MLNKPVKCYMSAVFAAGLAVIIIVFAQYPIHNIKSVLFLTLLAILAESQTVAISDSAVSVTIAVIICAMLTGGRADAVLVAALSVFGSVTKIKGKGYLHVFNTPPLFTLFNIGVYILSFAACSFTYFLLGGKTIQLSQYSSFNTVLYQINSSALMLIAAIFAAILLNTVLIAVYMSLREGGSVLNYWISSLLWSVVSLFIVGLIGVIITSLYAAYGWFLVLLFFAPFLLARYAFVVYKDLRDNYLQTVKSLATAIEAKDEYTIGHSRRVESYANLIAEEMKLSRKRSETLRYAALLHDIGKIAISEQVLNKPNGLSETEWSQIRSHPEKGAHIIEDVEFLSKAAEIIKTHHEKYDGTGYPKGLTAKELSLESLILSVADAYDAMTSDRPYHKKLAHEEALNELYRNSGTHFSPDVVKAFDRAMKKRGNVISDF